MKEPISIRLKSSFLLLAVIVLMPLSAFAASAPTPLRLLYPSFSSSWATAWIAKEAGYFLDEGLDVELIRVGGSTRMVAAMLGGSAPIIQAGAAAALAATAAGSDVVIIGATGTVSPFRLMARPEIKQPSDLKGKKAGITTFGSTSDQVVRIALKKFNLEPNKDVQFVPTGTGPERLAAMGAGRIDATFFNPSEVPQASKAGLVEVIQMADIGFDVQGSGLATSRSYIRSERETVKAALKAYIEGIYFVFANKGSALNILSRYMRTSDPEVLEYSYQHYLKRTPKKPYPTMKGIQNLIDMSAPQIPQARTAKPEQFVDLSFLHELEKEKFFDEMARRYK